MGLRSSEGPFPLGAIYGREPEHESSRAAVSPNGEGASGWFRTLDSRDGVSHVRSIRYSRHRSQIYRWGLYRYAALCGDVCTWRDSDRRVHPLEETRKILLLFS